MDFHLIWIDVCRIVKMTYFNLIWHINKTDDETRLHKAEPPSYVIFYDLNTAQLAHFYKEYSIEKNWELELVDCYVKARNSSLARHRSRRPKSRCVSACTVSPTKLNRSKSSTHLITTQSNEDIYYICQFRMSKNTHTMNKLHHSVVDKKFLDNFREQVKFNYKQNYMPVRVVPMLFHVNTMENRHMYYTSVFKPVDRKLLGDEEIGDDPTSTNLYCFRKDLNDFQFISLFETMKKHGWKLVDMKAYEDEKSMTKFSTIWANNDGIYGINISIFVFF